MWDSLVVLRGSYTVMFSIFPKLMVWIHHHCLFVSVASLALVAGQWHALFWRISWTWFIFSRRHRNRWWGCWQATDTTIGWWVSCTMRSFSFFLHFHDCGTSSFSTWPVSHIAQWFSRNATVLIEMILCNCITMYNYSIHLVILLLWVLLVILLVFLLLLLLHHCFCNYGSSVHIHFYCTLLSVMFSIAIGW